MSDKTVRQLAEMVKTPLEQLFKQLQKAGLSASSAEDIVNDEQQMQLLSHLRKSHGKTQGEADNSPKRVSLERREFTKIKQANVPGSPTKTISVEVRKKKTYIKCAETNEQNPIETIPDFAEQSNTPEMITTAVEIETTAPVTTEVQLEQVAPVVEESQPEIESVNNTADTLKPEIMPSNVNITETLPPVLSDLSLEQLVDTYTQVDQQSQLLKGLILLEARNRFASNNDFGKWVESVGTLCSDTRQARTRYMNFAEYFKGKDYTGISVTCCYEISAPINADVADKVYEYALNKNLSVAQVREQIQIAKGLLPSNANETTEESEAPELLPPEDFDRFKDQVLSSIAGLAEQDAIRVLKACMKAVVK